MAGDKVDLFEMANLSPTLTGLPMVVWVSERGRARHDVRIKVHTAHGRQMSISNTATVAVRSAPRLIAGQLSAVDMQAVSEWIRRHWSTIGTAASTPMSSSSSSSGCHRGTTPAETRTRPDRRTPIKFS